MEAILAITFTLGLPFLAILAGLFIKYKQRQWKHIERIKLIENGLLTADTENEVKKPFDKFDLLYHPIRLIQIILFVYLVMVLMASVINNGNGTHFPPVQRQGLALLIGISLCFTLVTLLKLIPVLIQNRYPIIIGCMFLTTFLAIEIFENTVHLAKPLTIRQIVFSTPLEVPGILSGDTLAFNLEDFPTYDRDFDNGKYLRAMFVHDKDSLYITLIGSDSFPFKRVIPEVSSFSVTNDYSCTDRFRIAYQYGRETDTAFTCTHMFNGKGVKITTLKNQPLLETRIDNSDAFTIEINDRKYSYRTALPLNGYDEILINLRRKYYGGRDLIFNDKAWQGNHSFRIFKMM
jgi:hypothetical protein